MKSQIRHWCNVDGVRHERLGFICPGCAEWYSGLHLLPVNTTVMSPSWDWDGNLEAPTLSPSIMTDCGEGRICHSFLRNGVFEFLSDSTHSLAGQRVPMPELNLLHPRED